MSDIEKTDIAFGEIANALKSSASDHILGIAEDIYDSDLKKYQSEINAELSNKNFDDKYAPISHTHSKSEITDFAHTHNYAGSSSPGSAATSANQLNKITGSTPGTAAKSGTSVAYYTLIGTTKDENNKRYAGDNTGFPVTSNANGLLWLGNHPNASDSSAIGYGSQLGFSSDGNIYYRYITNGSIPTTANGGSWKKLSYDGHTHDSAYLRLSGGTMTGTINSTHIFPTVTNTYNLGRNSNLQYNNTYSKTFVEDGISLVEKYAPIIHNHDDIYKPLQTPVTDIADDTRPAFMFISSITQDVNGVISAEKRTVPIMTGATLRDNGRSGLVPAPTTENIEMFLKGNGSWATPANATTSADGFMSAEDKTKLDKVQNYYKLTIDTSSWDGVGSLNNVTTLADDVDIHIKFGDRIRICSSEDFENLGYTSNPYKNLSTITVKIGEISYRLRCVNVNYDDFDVQSSPMAGAGFNNFQLGDDDYNTYNVLYKFGGYIDAIIVGFDVNVSNGYLYVPIYNSHMGYISKISQSSKTIKITSTTENATHPLVFTSNVAAGNKSLHIDSENSCHYNPRTNTLTVPIISASGSCAFGVNTNVKSTFNIKGSNHNSDVITMSGNSTTAAPYILIKAAGDGNKEGIRLTGRTSSVSANIKVYSSSGSSCTITGGSTSISSDERLKNFENDIEIDFDKLKNIPKKYFTWKHDDEKVLNIGTSAQEVEKIYPEIVEEFLNENEGKNYKSVDYSKLSIIALAAIDKLNERITELENKLKEYEQA